jgi:hypothetical protein
MSETTSSLAIALRNMRNEHLEEAATIAEHAFGPAHTYASENADRYREQDRIAAFIAGLIREAKR